MAGGGPNVDPDVVAVRVTFSVEHYPNGVEELQERTPLNWLEVKEA